MVNNDFSTGRTVVKVQVLIIHHLSVLICIF